MGRVTFHSSLKIAHIAKNLDPMQIGPEEGRFQNQTGRSDLKAVLVKD
jgi:hypothetical protein